jgi:hypothetical protein
MSPVNDAAFQRVELPAPNATAEREKGGTKKIMTHDKRLEKCEHYDEFN